MIDFTLFSEIQPILLHASHDHSDHSFALFAGLTAAVLHVVSGPDHLAAVTPLAVETRRKVWKIGLLWGVGHLIGMLLIGALFILFKEFLPLEQISEYSEQLVAIVLIAVGLWAFYSIFRKDNTHVHPHVHAEGEPYIHVHKHEHESDALDHSHRHAKKQKQNLWSSFSIGVLHGLAGIAHFILLLPVLGFEDRTDGLQYIAGFGIGTVFAMTFYTFLLGVIAGYSKKLSNPSFFRGVRLFSGLFALVVGVYWLYLTF